MGVSSCVVESQSIFIPCLVELLTDCGLDVVSVASFVDLDMLASLNPSVIFIDLDFVEDAPLDCLQASRRILPSAIIVAYTQQRESDWFASCFAAGATLVLDKAAPEGELREHLAAAVSMHAADAHRSERASVRGSAASE